MWHYDRIVGHLLRLYLHILIRIQSVLPAYNQLHVTRVWLLFCSGGRDWSCSYQVSEISHANLSIPANTGPLFMSPYTPRSVRSVSARRRHTSWRSRLTVIWSLTKSTARCLREKSDIRALRLNPLSPEFRQLKSFFKTCLLASSTPSLGMVLSSAYTHRWADNNDRSPSPSVDRHQH